MDKPSVKKEISELATSIKTQVDNFGERVSEPELDELMGKIGALHKRCSVLEHMNAPYNAAIKAEKEKTIVTPPPVEEKPSEPIITPAPQQEAKPEEAPIIPPAPPEKPVAEKEETPVERLTVNTDKMPIGINDKFQFIKELFAGDADKYNAAMEKLNSIGIKEEAELYFKSLQEINKWDEESETVQRLLIMMQGRFV